MAASVPPVLQAPPAALSAPAAATPAARGEEPSQPVPAAVAGAGAPPPVSPAPVAAPAVEPARPAPAAQLAPVLVQLAHRPGGGTMTLRLDPVGLGHVEIRVERAADGTASVHVAVERPDTLRLLVADAPDLHRALDQAGVPADGRSLSLSLDSSPNGTAGGGPGGDGSGGGGAPRHGRPAGGGEAAPATADPGRWLRAGIDITA